MQLLVAGAPVTSWLWSHTAEAYLNFTPQQRNTHMCTLRKRSPGNLVPVSVMMGNVFMQSCKISMLCVVLQTVRELAQGSTGRAAVARHEHVMFSLIQLLLSTHLQDRLDWHKSSTRERLKDGLHLHIFHNLKTALQYCTAALITLAMEPEGRSKLQSYESHLAEVAMTDLPQAEWIAVLLYKVFCSGVHSRRPV